VVAKGNSRTTTKTEERASEYKGVFEGKNTFD
jgi:hypothetical protein